eukprot:TRINITY_DN10860_c0_g2_i4.p2 TRINITY_DN10860_c0_g2~~TRINITY_DN10860_c0_g2_i4.p2  ORF type:complete len:130 (-),score=30.25 TRINITY_DN10860_c0_g2_i4:727-1083(-)
MGLDSRHAALYALAALAVAGLHPASAWMLPMPLASQQLARRVSVAHLMAQQQETASTAADVVASSPETADLAVLATEESTLSREDINTIISYMNQYNSEDISAYVLGEYWSTAAALLV